MQNERNVQLWTEENRRADRQECTGLKQRGRKI